MYDPRPLTHWRDGQHASDPVTRFFLVSYDQKNTVFAMDIDRRDGGKPLDNFAAWYAFQHWTETSAEDMEEDGDPLEWLEDQGVNVSEVNLDL